MDSKNNDSRMHVALTFDENFWAPAFATMRSIGLATRRRGDLVFHLCHGALPTKALADLDRIAVEFGCEVRHHRIDQDAQYLHLTKLLPHTRHISEVMYARLLLDKILPQNISRLVYIDCDILVRAPIETLFDADLVGRPVGAVADPHALRWTNGRDVAEDRDLLDPADRFFNSGLLLIDLEAWRRFDLSAQLQRLEAEGLLKRLHNDQVILNYLFRENWTMLDMSWNAQSAGRAMEMLGPNLVHYTGPNKPWNLINGLPFARVYRHVMTNELFYRYFRYRLWRRWTGLFGFK